MASKNGFQIFRYWYQLYGSVTTRPLPPYQKFEVRSKVVFNGRIRVLKDQFGYDTKDIKALMLFAVLHDPLLIGCEEYGNLDYLLKSATPFNRWRKAYADEIATTYQGNELKAIVAFAPKEQEELLDSETFHEFAKAFV